jgi:hypothetical protein
MTAAPHIWSEDALLRKARVYAERASDVETGTSLEQLWSLFAVELLARAAVARVHPVLLADPQDGAQLLHAFGFGNPKPPRSVPITTVFRRCQAIVPRFTESLTRDAVALMNLRNEELHTGGTVLETLRSSTWQPKYYAICEVLLDFLGLGLDDFFPSQRASTARTILDGLAQDVESAVKERIADRSRWFRDLDDGERATHLRDQVSATSIRNAPASRERIVACPSCGSKAAVGGEAAGSSAPRVGDGEIERDIRMLPTRFACAVCDLCLEGHAELYHAGLGDEFSVLDAEDPLDYYGIDPKDYVTIEDLVGPEYGNE